MKRLVLTIGLAAFIGGGGCAGCEDHPIDDDQGDGGGVTPDGGPGPGVRRLVERPLLGALPIQNRVFDPTFALPYFAWSTYGAEGMRLMTSVVLHPDAPANTPSLRIDDEGLALSDQVVIGMARGGAAPLRVGVWVASLGPDRPIRVQLQALGRLAAAERVYELPPAPSVPGFTDAHGMVWVRHEAVIEDDLPGWVMLSVAGRGPFELNGPELVAGMSAAGIVSGPLPRRASSRAPSPEERRLARAHLEWLRRASPPRRVLEEGQRRAAREHLRRMARALGPPPQDP